MFAIEKLKKKRKRRTFGFTKLCFDVLREIFKYLYTRELIQFCLICTEMDDAIYNHFLLEINIIKNDLVKDLCLYDGIDVDRLKESKFFTMFYNRSPNPKIGKDIKYGIYGLIYLINKEEHCSSCVMGGYNVTRLITRIFKFSCHSCKLVKRFCCQRSLVIFKKGLSYCVNCRLDVCNNCTSALRKCFICKKESCATRKCFLCNGIYCHKDTFACGLCSKGIGFCDNCVYSNYIDSCGSCGGFWYYDMSLLQNYKHKFKEGIWERYCLKYFK